MKNLTIKEVRNFGYRHPEIEKLYKDRALTEQLNAIRYIDHLAGVTKTDVSDIKLEHFMNQNGNLHVYRTEINKVFFEIKSQIPNFPTPAPVIAPARLLEFNKAFIKQMKQRFIEKQNMVQNNLRSARTFAKRSSDANKLLMESKLEEMALSKQLDAGIDLEPQVKQVLSAGFFKLEESGLRFYTPKITLSYFNEVQKVQNTCPMGDFTVELYLDVHEGLRAFVSSRTNNVRAGDYIHPHISNNGEICYGDSKGHAIAAMKSMDLPELMSIIQCVLANYSNGNPYIYLYSFQKAYEDKLNGKAMATYTANNVDPNQLGFDVSEEQYDEDESSEEPEEEVDDNGNPF